MDKYSYKKMASLTIGVILSVSLSVGAFADDNIKDLNEEQPQTNEQIEDAEIDDSQVTEDGQEQQAVNETDDEIVTELIDIEECVQVQPKADEQSSIDEQNSDNSQDLIEILPIENEQQEDNTQQNNENNIDDETEITDKNIIQNSIQTVNNEGIITGEFFEQEAIGELDIIVNPVNKGVKLNINDCYYENTYYKSTLSDDEDNKPILDQEFTEDDLENWLKCLDTTKIEGEVGTPIYVQVIRVQNVDGKNLIKAYSQGVATPKIQAPSGYETDENGIMAYKDGGKFDLNGYFAGDWKQTTYNNKGFYTYFKRADTFEQISCNSDEQDIKCADGVTVKMDLDCAHNGNFVKINYTVKNDSEEAVTYSLGSSADIQIGNDDKAKITKIDDVKGFKMVSASSSDKDENDEYAQFNFVGSDAPKVTDVDALWFGKYSNWYRDKTNYTFYDEDKCYVSEDRYDSAMAYSWQDRTIEPNETQEYCVLIGVGGKDSFVVDENDKPSRNTSHHKDRDEERDITYVYNPNYTLDKKQAKEKINKAVEKEIENAKNSEVKNVNAEIKLKNIDVVRPTDFKGMAKDFNDAIENEDIILSALFDSTTKEGKVLARLYVDVDEGAKLDKNINTLIYNENTYSKNIKAQNTFKKYFNNDVIAVTFGQKDSFGINVKVAVKVDLKDMNKENLYIYKYNPEKNTYTRLYNSNYYFDVNDYLHFDTDTGNQVIITDKRLA